MQNSRKPTRDGQRIRPFFKPRIMLVLVVV